MKFARPINDSTPNITNPFSGSHTGIDYGYPDGTLVYAAADGSVTMAKGDETRQWIANQPGDPWKPARGSRGLKTEDYGNFIKIAHAEGYSTLYAHLKYGSLLVAPGTQVKRGQPIAAVGSTGNSTGNHLHWEVRLNDQSVAPAPLTDTSFAAYGQPEPVIPVPSKTFEELVTKSTRYDAFVALGYSTADDLQKKVIELERDKTNIAKELQEAHGVAKNLADEIRTMEEQRQETAGQLIDVSHERDQLRMDFDVIAQAVGLQPGASAKDIATAATTAAKPTDEIIKEYEKQLEAAYQSLKDCSQKKKPIATLTDWLTYGINMLLSKVRR